MTLQLKPETAAALEALASAKGLSVDEYLQRLLDHELPSTLEAAAANDGSGMVWENGLFVYRTGRPLPLHLLDEAIRHVREARAKHLLGDRS